MRILDHRNQSVNVHQFAMVPKAEIPRSSFRRPTRHLTTFDENNLVPFFVDEVLPGDTRQLSATIMARLTTPIYPIMDNLYLDTFFFFVPNRLVWTHWENFMGAQNNPADSISYTIPVVNASGGGYGTGSLQDYMGLPTIGQIASGNFTHSALPLRCYNLIWNEWFRDENLQNSVPEPTGDGPDTAGTFTLLKRGKRPDYFTKALPWTQKGGTAITVPIGGQATVKTNASSMVTAASSAITFRKASDGSVVGNPGIGASYNTSQLGYTATTPTVSGAFTAVFPDNLYADLSTATSVTINALRQSFQIQKFLERDARSGTRYTELLRAHFGVINPDFRLQRPEYLGGGTTPVNIAPIPQTAQTGLTGGTTPLGTLGGHGMVVAKGHGFAQSFTEHGHIIGLLNIRADQTYQQGLRKMWSRSTRFEFYDPAFAMLGEQSVLNQEIYIQGSAGGSADTNTFGYQERWAEYRYFPSMVTGQMRSTYATPLDAWHLAEKFTSLPTLGATFIQMNAPIARVSAAPVTGSHFIGDIFIDEKCTRPMPMYSVPGLIDHF